MADRLLRLYDFEPAMGLVCEQILSRLAKPIKELPDALLYSERGSRYFEEVTGTPGYYLARTEIAIMETHAGEMADVAGPGALLVEYGSGSSRKTRMLLDAMPGLAGYVPIDISKDFLLDTTRRLADDYPALEILPVCADYEQEFDIPAPDGGFQRKVAYFPGSTIGNRPREEALRFLAKIRRDMGPSGGMLIGVDLSKPPEILAGAYNEREPVVNAFVLSALENLNENYNSDFDTRQFRFKFAYDSVRGRVEILLLSLRAQLVRVCGQPVEFGENEPILLQVACKYTLEDFAALASEAGWRVEHVWTDPKQYFSIQYLGSA